MMWSNVKWFLFVAGCSIGAAVAWPIRWVLSKFEPTD